MANYVLLYSGGSMPETEAEQAQVMQAWSDWLGSASDMLVDGGAPIGQKKSISPDGAVSDGGGDISGYSVVKADSLDDAVAFAKACPHLTAGGTVEVGEAMEM
ncbi:MAG TPA: YciI family protein [Acidimicrobiia bacterium]|jgi:hypothetical protein|nr:YciI family protein [Acidimicrobiia bacterium]